jgi:hypothetical protein
LSHRTDAPQKNKPNAVVAFILGRPGRRLVSVGISKDQPMRTSEARLMAVSENA